MNIDFTSQVYECGKTGEHNANSVTVTIPNSMVHTGSLYRLAFWGMANCNSIRTDALTVVDGKVTYNLPYEITSLVEAKMTLEEYVENELVRKSEMVTIKFSEAVPDGEEGVTGETPVMLEIQKNTEARHTHLNYDTLADFSESATGDLFFNDKLYYNADRVDYEIEQAIEQSDGDLIEIVSSGSTSYYTASELRNMGDSGKSFSYNGTPVVAWAWINNMFRFKYVAMGSNSAVCFRIKAVSNTKTIINYAGDDYPVISVNTKTGTGITLDASDIVAPSGWTPPANNSLATKKYVDDHASVSTWDGIEGKPSTFPPSTHTHTVSQITDYSPYDDTAIKGRVEVIEGKESGWDAKQNAITSTNKLDYSLIANTPSIPTVPSNVSAFTNDAGYLTEHQSLADYPTTTTVEQMIATKPQGSNVGDVLMWNGSEWVARRNRLPANYQEVEYIYSDGNQKIKVANSFTYNAKTRMVIDFQMDNITRGSILCGYVNTGAFLWCGANPTNYRYGVMTNYSYSTTDNERHKFDIASGIQKFDDVTISNYAYTTSATSGLYIFSESTGEDAAKCRIYEAIIYQNNIEKYHCVPCYNKFTNEIGMYDMVNDKFYTNAGTGTFLKGADV